MSPTRSTTPVPPRHRGTHGAPLRQPARRRAARPRYGRIMAFCGAILITLVTVLAGSGILPLNNTPSYGAVRSSSSGEASISLAATLTQALDAAQADMSDTSTKQDSAPPTTLAPPAAPGLPAGSGSGRRIVFDMSEQRVWLVDKGSDVARSYLVSGSLTHNLKPGTYAVYSKSPWAVGVDDSGVMQYMVRFTQGPSGAAIGFHSIPTSHGVALQTRKQLGTPQSHGCIRQWIKDAKALWDFAPIGTKVVVTA